MRDGRRHNADEINVRASNDLSPIARNMLDIKLTAYALRVLTMPARNRNDARALASAKARNLRRAREARADDADAYEIFFSQLSPRRNLKVRSKDRPALLIILPPAGVEPTTHSL